MKNIYFKIKNNFEELQAKIILVKNIISVCDVRVVLSYQISALKLPFSYILMLSMVGFFLITFKFIPYIPNVSYSHILLLNSLIIGMFVSVGMLLILYIYFFIFFCWKILIEFMFNKLRINKKELLSYLLSILFTILVFYMMGDYLKLNSGIIIGDILFIVMFILILQFITEVFFICGQGIVHNSCVRLVAYYKFNKDERFIKIEKNDKFIINKYSSLLGEEIVMIGDDKEVFTEVDLKNIIKNKFFQELDSKQNDLYKTLRFILNFFMIMTVFVIFLTNGTVASMYFQFMERIHFIDHDKYDFPLNEKQCNIIGAFHNGGCSIYNTQYYKDNKITGEAPIRSFSYGMGNNYYIFIQESEPSTGEQINKNNVYKIREYSCYDGKCYYKLLHHAEEISPLHLIMEGAYMKAFLLK